MATKKELLQIFQGRKPTLKQIDTIVVQSRLKEIDYAMLYTYFDFSVHNSVLELISAGKNKEQTRKTFNRFVTKWVDKYKIEFETVRLKVVAHVKTAKATDKTAKTVIDKATERISKMLGLVGNLPKEAKESIALIIDGKEKPLDQKIIDLKICQELYMQVAQGKLTTKKSWVTVVATVDEETGEMYDRRIKTNKDGHAEVKEEHTEYLPNKDYITAYVFIEEVILSLEAKNTQFETREEQKQRYLEYIREAEEKF